MEYQPATTYRAREENLCKSGQPSIDSLKVHNGLVRFKGCPDLHRFVVSQRCLVHIGSISLTVFQLPDGSYRLSQKEVAGVIDKPARSSFAFLHSKHLKTILGEGSNVSPEFEKVAVEGSQGLITPIPIELALLYWHKWAQQENAKALALVLALAKQSIYSAADEAFGITRTKQERDRLLADDLSDQGIAQIEAMRQSLNQQMFGSHSETKTERELKLKIQLAEIELSQQRLQSAKDSNNYPAKDIDKIGVPPWVVIPWTQKTLCWSDATAAFRLLRRLGYGFKGEKWFTLKVVGELWLLPWPAFEALTKAVEKFKSELN